MVKTINYCGHPLTLSFDVVPGELIEHGDYLHPDVYGAETYTNVELVEYEGPDELPDDLSILL